MRVEVRSGSGRFRLVGMAADEFPALPTPNDVTLFKVPAAFLIEKSGWKGKEIGNVKVSEKHALVLVVKKGSDSKELLEVRLKLLKIYLRL